MPREFFARLEMKARIPIGFDGIWAVILELDATGPWTAGDVRARAVNKSGTPHEYLRRLRAGGYVVVVGSRTSAGNAKNVGRTYRLTSRPTDAPRLRRDGTEKPEPLMETMWRTIKMAKTFTLDELAAMASKPGEPPINRNTVMVYCDRLAVAKVLARTPKPRGPSQYRLIHNLGAKAPKVLSTKVVFDPNTNTVIGEAELVEVRA